MIHTNVNHYSQKHMQLKYLPNIISLFRLILVIPFVLLFINDKMNLAFYVFLLAAFSDGLDGWLARYFNCQSHLGLILDPLADKILIISCYILLAFKSILPLWFVGIVLFRDCAILFGSFITLFIYKLKRPLSPSIISKINTVLQMLQIVLCLIQSAFQNVPRQLLSSFVIFVLSTSILSFFHYLYVWQKNLKSSTYV